MQHAKHIKENIFADILGKIQSLSLSQQKFLQELLSGLEPICSYRAGKKGSISFKKNLLRKSFGIWDKRKDIKDSSEYVDDVREGWEIRLKRIRG